MKIEIKDIVNTIEEEDLYKLANDLDNNAPMLKKLVKDKLKEIENEKRSFCAGCGEDIREKEKVYTLIFGHEGTRKKASFCAHDCLEFFLAKLKEIEAERLKLNERIKERQNKDGFSQHPD